MKIRTYIHGDLNCINPRIDVMNTSIKDQEWVAVNGYTFTFLRDGVPVACFGAFKLYTAVYHAWCIASDNVRGRGLTFTKSIKDIMQTMAVLVGAKRINVQVDSSKKENLRFARVLGFEEEYIQFNAGPNANGDIVGMVHWPKGIHDEYVTTKHAAA